MTDTVSLISVRFTCLSYYSALQNEGLEKHVQCTWFNIIREKFITSSSPIQLSFAEKLITGARPHLLTIFTGLVLIVYILSCSNIIPTCRVPCRHNDPPVCRVGLDGMDDVS